MSSGAADGAARMLSVRLTPLGRSFQLFALTALVLALIVALGDSSGAGGMRAGTLLFVPLLGLALSWLAPLLAWLPLRRVEARAGEPVTGHAGDEVVLPLELENRSRRWCARDVIVSAGRARAGVVRPVALVAELGARSRSTVPCAWRLLRRGRRRRVRLTLLTTFPFGLAEARLELVLAADILVLPRLGALRGLERLPSAGGGAREARRVARAGSAELRGLREWREGEDEHLIHWKVSARRGKPVLRELGGEERGNVRLILLGAVESLPPARGDEPPWHEGFERAVSLAATLAETLLARHPAVRLTFAGDRIVEGPESRGLAGLAPLLAVLAEVEPHEGAAPDVRALARDARRRGEAPVVVHAGGAPGGTGEGGLVALDVEGSDAGLLLPARRAPSPLAAAGGGA